MIKNKYIFLLGVAFLLSGSTQAQWIKEYVPITNNLNSISLFNEASGWVVGDKGTMLYKFKDTWVKYKKLTDEDLFSVCMININDGWAVGAKGTILHFDGREWETIDSPTSEKLYSVSFSDAENGYASGAHGTVIKYEAGKWVSVEKITIGNLFSVSFKGDIAVLGGGLECRNVPIMRIASLDTKKPVKMFDPNLIEIKGLSISAENNVWAVGSPGIIFHFDGKEWTRLEQYNHMPSLNSIFFNNENKGIAVGYSGTIMTYSGEVWSREVSPEETKLNGTAIFGNTYYAVGNDGTILSNTLKSEIISRPASNNISGIEIVSYPNPAADAVKVIIPQEIDFSAGQITITNTNGQVIYKNKISLMTGDKIYEINTSEFSTGFYFIHITSTTGIGASGKLIVKH